MFKSRINFNAFNKHNTKVANVEVKKLKGLTKAAVKKLLTSPEERTSFFLVLNYFQDSTGHFLDFGINKKLAKHFEQVEMKSGKLDKSMSASQKEASMGEVYAKEENGKKTLYFVPDAASKIPDGKWPKILKELKPLINSMKAVVVLNGAVVEEEDSASIITETPANVEEQRLNLEQLKTLFKPISKLLKETLPKEIVPRIKSQKITEVDYQVVEQLQVQVRKFLEAYQQGDNSAQTALVKVKATLEAQQEKIASIAKAIQAQLRISSNTTTELPKNIAEEALLKNLEALLKQAQDSLLSFNKDYKRLQSDLEAPSTPIPEGAAFLTGLQL